MSKLSTENFIKDAQYLQRLAGYDEASLRIGALVTVLADLDRIRERAQMLAEDIRA